MSKETVRTTFVLPLEIAERLKEFIPDRKRSEFVAEAIEQHLMKMIFKQGRELSFGKWKNKDYPNLNTQEDMDKFIHELRSDESWRMDHKGEK